MSAKLGIPLQELQAKTTSTEFTRWMLFLEQEERTRNEKWEFYAARMIGETRRSWVSTEQHDLIDDTDFLIRPRLSNKARSVKKKKSKLSGIKPGDKGYVKATKCHWMALAGIKSEKIQEKTNG